MRRIGFVVAAALLALLPIVGAGPAQAADSYVTISGAGSTWSAVAINAWAVDMNAFGLTVNYAPTGSTDGRFQYRVGTVDFGVSEIPYEDAVPPEQLPSRSFAYMPIVAGGTAFMYHLTVGGRQITDLRLSGETLTKIFTGQITNWGDPQITRDYGRALPSEPIVPVVRSDGSGTTAQFSLYMSKKFPSIWGPFCTKYAGLNPCGELSFFPNAPNFKRQNGSNGVSGYVSAAYGEGSITYVEYAYPKALHYPVVKVLNQAGYYTLPTAPNVAVALTKAVINPNLTQNLDGVYANPDPRTYPLSSYSYMIVPTSTATPFSTNKGRSLTTFMNYFLCAGQQKADVLGYSPLPVNLVNAGFAVVRKVPGFVAPPSLSSCNNPALSILQSAPQPSACDKVGTPNPCVVRQNPGSGNPTTNPTGGQQPNGSTPNGSGGGGGIDPVTGLATGGSGSNSQVVSGTATGDGAPLYANPVEVAASRSSGNTSLLGGLAGLELLLVILVPPLVGGALLRRRRRAAGGSNP
jgi:phosphate transport system substrate-binding protein